MATSDNVRKLVSRKQHICDTDIWRRELNAYCVEILGWVRKDVGNVSAERLAGLVKALAEGDRAKFHSLLRRWRVWGSDVETSLSCRRVRDERLQVCANPAVVDDGTTARRLLFPMFFDLEDMEEGGD